MYESLFVTILQFSQDGALKNNTLLEYMEDYE